MSIESLLRKLNFFSEEYIKDVEILLILVIGCLLGWLVYYIAKKWLAKIVLSFTKRTSFKWDDLLLDSVLFSRLGLLLAPLVIRLVVSGIEWDKIVIVEKILDMWILFAATALIIAFLAGVNRVYESFPMSKDKPIKVFIQVIDIFICCIAGIIAIGMLTGKDVTTLLAGLTAFAAVLMLVFQNSILGLVAGIQLSANNMLRIGDWIEVPGAKADGDVLEINLTTVKVQNWDKTITTIPTHKLVSDSFINWRGMQESRGRRIKRSISIDINSIHYLSEEDINQLKNSSLLKDYIEKKEQEITLYNASKKDDLDKRKLTNIGTFREYLELSLSSNPNINQEMTHMVRQLQPTATGVPLEIYCFSALQSWVDYENVQSDLFDHVFAVMKLFGLRAFQYSGDHPM
ncbi:mechanosensitive ion channel [Bacteroidales bacterium OttesenSCG-928-A17]|nr:mechanosensitive ion channel [Bacteroidales bacterium OttesenSCG-928-A17]